ANVQDVLIRVLPQCELLPATQPLSGVRGGVLLQLLRHLLPRPVPFEWPASVVAVRSRAVLYPFQTVLLTRSSNATAESRVHARRLRGPTSIARRPFRPRASFALPRRPASKSSQGNTPTSQAPPNRVQRRVPPAEH